MVAIGGMPATEQDGPAAWYARSLPGRTAAAVGPRVPERKETAGGGSQIRLYRKLLWAGVTGFRMARRDTWGRESCRPRSLSVHGADATGGDPDAACIAAQPAAQLAKGRSRRPRAPPGRRKRRQAAPAPDTLLSPRLGASPVNDCPLIARPAADRK